MGSLSLLQGIFPTQGSNPGLLCYGWILYQLSHKGSPRILEWVAYPFSSGSSRPRNWTRVSCIAGRFFTNWATREPLFRWKDGYYLCVCVCVCVCICAQQDVAPPSTFLQWVRVNMSSASAKGSASSSHTCLLIWAAKMEPYGYLWTFNRSKAFSSKSQFIGLLYSHGISAFWVGIIYHAITKDN